MFNNLVEKFQSLFTNFGKKKLTEDNLKETTKEVKLALLEADVNFEVASSFVEKIQTKSIGEAVLKSVTPKQQFIKIVHEELIALMGKDESKLELTSSPSTVLLVGLQGSGKTTFAAKLAKFLKKEGKRVLISASDLQRPAAIEQLKILGKEAGIDIFSLEGERSPLIVAKRAKEKAKAERFDVLIVDTAGRLHINEELMKELEDMKSLLNPDEVLFVANGATGQDILNVALEFDKRINISGSVLTMLDGDARAGAAISIREVTKKPLKFESIGERLDDIRLFNPTSMADRILGMGDIINLVKKAQENFDSKAKEDLEQKFKKSTFNYEDYLKQMGAIKKMGSFKGLMKMMPGMGGMEFPEDEFKMTEAMIMSMTPGEREERVEIDYSRKKRIAKGSGIALDDINRMVKAFKKLKQMCKNMSMNKGAMQNMKNFKNQFGEGLWR